MDLTQFTSKKKENTKKEILSNNDIEVSEDDNYHYITIKSKEALYNNQKSLFCAPTTAIQTSSKEEAYKFFRQSLDVDKVEGLMFKAPNSTYSSGLRTGAMAKLKETKEDLDVVVLKAEHGQGKRAGYYSSFYVGVLNHEAEDDEDKFLTVGKVSSGIKELENSEEGISMMKITELLKPLKVSEDKEVTIFEPKIVLQIRYQEIQKSSIYDSGYALRFPRIIFYREDKDLEEINTIGDMEKFS
jgi:DNA ligase-1